MNAMRIGNTKLPKNNQKNKTISNALRYLLILLPDWFDFSMIDFNLE
jgi:hypothetical protein